MSSFFGYSKKENNETPPNTAGTTKSTFSTKSSKAMNGSASAQSEDAPSQTTTRIHTKPAPGTDIGPIHKYDEKQNEMMKQVKEVPQLITFHKLDTHFLS